ncbi:MAG: ABC transporter permease subunit, partial [Proteobacteria bacterium]|nr:ABC transporter permease subunit [Pseudomonadota bacterium]
GHRVEIALEWNMVNTYSGLILPLIASATATFLFRQFFLTVPDELCEAARLDGASPMRFFRSILLPLSTSNMIALAIILFLYGWNQYLWPLLFTTDKSMATAVIGLRNLIPRSDMEPAWNVAMNAALLTMLPPVLVVLALQRWFVRGLIDSNK